MKTGTLVLVGKSPLLMHNPAAMKRSGGGKKSIPSAEDEAETSAYWMRDKSSLCIHAQHLHATLIGAAAGYRIQGRRSVIPYLSGCIEIAPDEISLGTTKYEVDVRPVMVQRARVLRARASVFPWTATATIEYDESVFTDDFMSTTFREIVEHAGRAVGLLDFAPRHRGRFGRFTIGTWTLGEAAAPAKRRRAS